MRAFQLIGGRLNRAERKNIDFWLISMVLIDHHGLKMSVFKLSSNMEESPPFLSHVSASSQAFTGGRIQCNLDL